MKTHPGRKLKSHFKFSSVKLALLAIQHRKVSISFAISIPDLMIEGRGEVIQSNESVEWVAAFGEKFHLSAILFKHNLGFFLKYVWILNTQESEMDKDCWSQNVFTPKASHLALYFSSKSLMYFSCFRTSFFHSSVAMASTMTKQQAVSINYAVINVKTKK